MTATNDAYEILGVPSTATHEEIRRAFRTAAKKRHPDRFFFYAEKILATRRMQELNGAYATLRDPASRRQYDARSTSSDHATHTAAEPSRAPASPSPRATVPQAQVHQAESGWPWYATLAVALTLVVSTASYVVWQKPTSPSAFAVTVVVGLLVSVSAASVLLFGVLPALIWVLALPVMLVRNAFSDTFEQRLAGHAGANVKRPHAWRIALDAALRSAGLAAVVACGVYATNRVGGSSELSALLLIVAGALAGELAAMVAYFRRSRSVLAHTSVLELSEPRETPTPR